MLMGAAAYALLNSSEALFLKRVGVDYLPLALLASSALLIVTTALLGRALAGADRRRWLPRVLLALGACVLPFCFALDAWRSPLIVGALLLVARQVLAVGLMVFWIVLGDMVTGRQAKRLFAPLAAGVTVGGIAGSFGSDPVARVVGVDGLLLVCAAALAGAALVAGRLHGAGPPRLERGLGAGCDTSVPPRTPATGSFREIWGESRLFRLLFVSLMCGGLLTPVLYFEFSYVADAATGGVDAEQRLLALYAQFRGWLNVALLVTQLWLSRRLYHTIGLPLSLALWPASYMLGFGGLGASLTLPVGVAALGAGRVAEDGISGSAVRVLFNLFPEGVRTRAASLLEGPVTRLGAALGNALLLLVLPLGAAWIIPWAALPVSLAWLVAALALWRAYPGLLLQASADRCLAGADKTQLLDPTTVRALGPSLADADPGVCRASIDLVADADPPLAVSVLADALEAAPSATRPLLVDALHRLVEPLPPGQLRSGDASAALARVLADRSRLAPEQRADVLQVYARLTGGVAGDLDGESAAVLRRALGDREAAVRLAAMAELHRRGQPPPGSPDLDAVLRGALAEGDVLVRRSARKELRAMLLSTDPDGAWRERLSLLAGRLEARADRAEAAEALVEVARCHNGAVLPCAAAVSRWFGDRDPRIRAAALRFAGHAGIGDESARLTSALGSAHLDEADAGREGLVALGPNVAPALLVEYGFGAPRCRDGILSVLRELEVDPETLADGYRRQLDEVRRALVLRGALGSDHPAVVVLRRLEERVAEGLGGLLGTLAVLDDDERIAELERRLRRAPDARRRDILVEALEALLAPDVRADVIPLLEAAPWERRARLAAGQLGRSVPAADEAARELLHDDDPLTASLAARFLSGPVGLMEKDARIGHSLAMLDPMDIAVRLQEVPAFGRLSIQQLVTLAAVLVEESYVTGDRVYREGDEGNGLYIILDGEIEITARDTVIDRHVAPAFFGELATLDGVPRSVTATVRRDARLLRLDRDDLVALMADAPTLGIGLSEFLSLRVRALAERLSSS